MTVNPPWRVGRHQPLGDFSTTVSLSVVVNAIAYRHMTLEAINGFGDLVIKRPSKNRYRDNHSRYA